MTDFFVRPTNGSDANDGLTFANAFQTFQKGLDTAVGGDEIRLCNEATETPSASVLVDTNTGSATSPILVLGADSIDGTPLTAGFYIVSGSSLPATTDLLAFSLASFHVLERVRITAATNDNVALGSAAAFSKWRNCRVDNASSEGVFTTSTGGSLRFIDCEIDNNGNDGLTMNAAGRGAYVVIGGSIHDNAGRGFFGGEDNNSTGLHNVEVYANGDVGIDLNQNGTVYDCTIFNNVGDGIRFTNHTGTEYIVNNTLSENGGFGLNFTGSDSEELMLIDYNHYDNNTSGETSFASTPGDNNVSGDPDFTNTTAGSENFIPLNTSPLIRAGVSGTTIGARHEADPAGGGGDLIIPNKRLFI